MLDFLGGGFGGFAMEVGAEFLGGLLDACCGGAELGFFEEGFDAVELVEPFGEFLGGWGVAAPGRRTVLGGTGRRCGCVGGL